MHTPLLICIFITSLLSLVLQLSALFTQHSSSIPLDSSVNETSRSGFHQTTYEVYQVKNTLAKHNSQFSTCWKNYLASPMIKKEEIKAAGALKLDWLISPSGVPSKVEVVYSEFSDLDLSSCIIAEVARIRFPSPPSAREVYTSNLFNFKKVESAEISAPIQ
jgi:hypothetical protein